MHAVAGHRLALQIKDGVEATGSDGRDQEPRVADKQSRAPRGRTQGLCATVAFIRSWMQKVQSQTNG